KDLRKGWVKVRIEDVDDLWILKNIIKAGDVVVSKTLRDVKVDGEGKRRLPMTLAIKVEKLYFQPFASRLRIHGIIVEGPEEYGLRGSHHTLNVDVGSEITLFKESISQALLRRLESLSNRRRFRALLVAADFDEVSLAILYDQGIRFLNDLTLPGIRSDDESSIESMATLIAEEVVRYLESEKIDFLIVGSPTVLREALTKELKTRIRGKLKIFTDSVSIGGRAGIQELLKRDSVKGLLQEFVIVEGEEILEKFLKLLMSDPERIAYGLRDVEFAALSNAVDILLVSEDLLTSDEYERIEKIFNVVEEKGGSVRIIPAESPLALKLKGFGGVIALLRFALPRSEDLIKQD
ncbi:MAG: mRNA surveillance protein Pelota, partial [Zestosphaera sp.]